MPCGDLNELKLSKTNRESRTYRHLSFNQCIQGAVLWPVVGNNTFKEKYCDQWWVITHEQPSQKREGFTVLRLASRLQQTPAFQPHGSWLTGWRKIAKWLRMPLLLVLAFYQCCSIVKEFTECAPSLPLWLWHTSYLRNLFQQLYLI